MLSTVQLVIPIIENYYWTVIYKKKYANIHGKHLMRIISLKWLFGLFVTSISKSLLEYFDEGNKHIANRVFYTTVIMNSV